MTGKSKYSVRASENRWLLRTGARLILNGPWNTNAEKQFLLICRVGCGVYSTLRNKRELSKRRIKHFFRLTVLTANQGGNAVPRPLADGGAFLYKKMTQEGTKNEKSIFRSTADGKHSPR